MLPHLRTLQYSGVTGNDFVHLRMQHKATIVVLELIRDLYIQAVKNCAAPKRLG